MPSQNQRSIRRSPPSELEQENENNHHLFMQEDETATWLHYPLDEDNFCAQLELLENNMNMSSTQTHTNNPMVRSSHVHWARNDGVALEATDSAIEEWVGRWGIFCQFPSRQKGYDEETKRMVIACINKKLL